MKGNSQYQNTTREDLTHYSPPQEIIGVPRHFPSQVVEDHGGALAVVAELLILKQDLVPSFLPDSSFPSLQDR